MEKINFKFMLSACLALWLSLLVVMLIEPSLVDDALITEFQIVFYALSCVTAKKIYTAERSGLFEIIFWLLMAAFITDSINYIVFNCLNHVNYFVSEPGKLGFALVDKVLHYADYIEILLWHLVVFSFLLKVVRPIAHHEHRFQAHFLIYSGFLAFVLVFLLYFSQPGKLHDPDFFLIVSFMSSIIEIATFIVSIYGLAHSRSRGIGMLLTSMVLMAITQISALFFYNYRMHEFIKIAYITGSLWVVLIFLALALLRESKDYDCSAWFMPSNTLEGRLAFSSLVIASLSCVMFFMVTYMFEPISEARSLNLFVFLMSYSLIAVLAAKRVANFFSKPFQQLRGNVAKFMEASDYIERPCSFDLVEFDYLQDVIYERFMERENQNMKIKKMADRAIQIAHDIRSPASAIMMLVKEDSNFPESQRVSLRGAASRVQEIANNLLLDVNRDVYDDSVNLMLVPAVMSLISEKRAQYIDVNCNLSLSIEESSNFSHARLRPIEFKCIVSNLVNNAFESIPVGRFGEVGVSIRSDDKRVIISIRDNGCGMTDSMLAQLKACDQIGSTKKRGFGLGLRQAINYIKDQGGEINVSSRIGHGTEVDICFALVNTPCWLADGFTLGVCTHVIILDDDLATHEAWDQRLRELIYNGKIIKVTHFYYGDECINYINLLDSSQKLGVALFADYELLGQGLNGLDVIEKTGIKKSLLVTSYYDDVEIIKRSILSNTKILPKLMAGDYPLIFDDNRVGTKDLGGCVLLDDQAELSGVIKYLAKSKSIKLDCYSNPYCLWAVIEMYPLETAIYIDYDLSLPVNGIDVAKFLKLMGFKNLYLATSYKIPVSNIPDYLTVLSSKMSLLDLKTQKV